MKQQDHDITRRDFLTRTAATAAGLALLAHGAQAAPASAPFRSTWEKSPDRVWAGAEFWTNPLQDWRVAGGRLECIKAAPGRTAHVLTRELTAGAGDLRMSVKLGRVDGGTIKDGKGAAGFSVGVKGPLNEYRNNLIFGNGFNVGLRAKGELFIGDGPNGKTEPVELGVEAVELRLFAEPSGEKFRVKLSAHDAKDGRSLGVVERGDVPADFLTGNLALAANFGATPGRKAAAQQGQPPGADRWWFADWRIEGSKVSAHEDRAFGPLLFNQYTLHRGTLKMSAQLPPLGEKDDQSVRLQIQRGDNWQTIGEAKMHPLARTATIRVEKWDDTKDAPYRLAYSLRASDGSVTEHFLSGVVRRDPVDKDELSVGDVSCNAHYIFPNTEAAAAMAKVNPDLLAFTGDQYYEPTGMFGVDASSVENACLDVLRKWYMHGWTWRELLRDRPSVSLPDDHDVYHGNLWGENGKAAPANNSPAEAKGGYKMMADFVNAVHVLQTAHHPDSPAKPGLQGVTGYYGPLTYGRVSFAILADRQYKSGPDGKVPPTTSGRADHVNDPNFDPKTADLPGLELLGGPQMEFLRAWTKDWRGADMKAAISQTLFTAMATHHGKRDGMLVADYDTNAWPQAGRNAAVRELRRVFAFHLAGDQHLPAVVHYGIEGHRDGVVAFASPAINNLYPRWYWPTKIGAQDQIGDFKDSFGHPLSVLACANPRDAFSGTDPVDLEVQKSAGIGIARFNKKARTITVDCWPLLADPTKPGTQFPGWPVTVAQLDNHSRRSPARLPELTITGTDKPLVEIVDEKSGETIYLLRTAGKFQPHTYAEGPHTIRVSDPETGRAKEFKSVVATKENSARLEVAL